MAINGKLNKIMAVSKEIVYEMNAILPTYIKLLCIDDDPNDSELLSGILSRSKKVNYKIDIANTYADALMLIKEKKHDIYLVDFKLNGGKNGGDLILEATNCGILGPFIIWSGYIAEYINPRGIKNMSFMSKGETNIGVLDQILGYAIKHGKIYNKLLIFENHFNELPPEIRAY